MDRRLMLLAGGAALLAAAAAVFRLRRGKRPGKTKYLLFDLQNDRPGDSFTGVRARNREAAL